MNKKVQCLERLFDLLDCYSEMVDFLVDEKLISNEELKELRLSYHKAEMIYNTIKRSLKEEKLMLADFEWHILPEERIRLIFVSSKQRLEFTHNW